MTTYKAKEKDSIASIAYNFGHFWQTIWNDSINARLKQERDDKNILYPGDIVHVPELRSKHESGNCNTRHRFRRKGVPEKLRIRIVDELSADGDDRQRQNNEPSERRTYMPRRNAPYTINVNGQFISGKTDPDGLINISIRPDAEVGQLIVDPGTPRELRLNLEVGRLNPLSKISGIKQRLLDLGLDPGTIDEEQTPDLAAAIRQFQKRFRLPVTGEVDNDTRTKIQDEHRS
jgi:N-acetylmuramoyl-L-alanine amidase